MVMPVAMAMAVVVVCAIATIALLVFMAVSVGMRAIAASVASVLVTVRHVLVVVVVRHAFLRANQPSLGRDVFGLPTPDHSYLATQASTQKRTLLGQWARRQHARRPGLAACIVSCDYLAGPTVTVMYTHLNKL